MVDRRLRVTDELPPALVDPHRDRLDPDHPRYDDIVATHRAAVAQDEDGYVDPASGYWVFSARYLWDRGFCCEQGCRHCPWVDRDADGDVFDREHPA